MNRSTKKETTCRVQKVAGKSRGGVKAGGFSIRKNTKKNAKECEVRKGDEEGRKFRLKGI